jgi:hypothetical protein
LAEIASPAANTKKANAEIAFIFIRISRSSLILRHRKTSCVPLPVRLHCADVVSAADSAVGERTETLSIDLIDAKHHAQHHGF